VAALLVNSTGSEGQVAVEWKQGAALSLSSHADLKDAASIVLALAEQHPQSLGFSAEIDCWAELAQTGFKSSKFPDLQVSFTKIDEHLKLRTVLLGNELTVADVLIWTALRAVPVWMKNFKDANKAIGSEIYRWFAHLSTQEAFMAAQALQLEEAGRLKEKKKDQGSFDIALDNAEMGKVVTRFPPEPSGYLQGSPD